MLCVFGVGVGQRLRLIGFLLCLRKRGVSRCLIRGSHREGGVALRLLEGLGCFGGALLGLLIKVGGVVGCGLLSLSGGLKLVSLCGRGVGCGCSFVCGGLCLVGFGLCLVGGVLELLGVGCGGVGCGSSFVCGGLCLISSGLRPVSGSLSLFRGGLARGHATFGSACVRSGEGGSANNAGGAEDGADGEGCGTAAPHGGN